MTDQTYNGWTNFQTWKVQLEQVANHYPNYVAILSFYQEIKEAQGKNIFKLSLQDSLAFLVRLLIKDSKNNCYSEEFLQQVNWGEIAESFISDYEEEEEQQQ